MNALMTRAEFISHKATRDHFGSIEFEPSLDIYECMKALSWKILLGIFVAHNSSSSKSLPSKDDELLNIESLQEDLLRGQFSLFPVSVNARFWRSPRSRGLQARKELQGLLRRRVRVAPNRCPIPSGTANEKEDVANHTLLFTSSLAAKALASLLTALLLNLYVLRTGDEFQSTQAEKLSGTASESERDQMLRSICLETERLSPPVVGIMRRATRDVILEASSETDNDRRTLIPKGWDVWLYFVAAARDPAAFGPSAETFLSERHCISPATPDEAKEGLAFGAGTKACLGKHMMRQVAMTVAKTSLGILPSMESQIRYRLHADLDKIPLGVQAWLGWHPGIEPEQWARDMKQLPTQRPTKAIMVEIRRETTAAATDDSLDDPSDTEWYDAQEYIS